MPNELSTISRRVLWAASALAVTVLAALGWSIDRAIDQHEQARAWVVHSHTIVDQIDALRTDIEAAAVAERNYLMTGDGTYTGPFNEGVAAADEALHALEDLTRHDPAQRRRLADLRRFWHQRVGQMKDSMDVRRTAGLEAASRVVLTPSQKRTVDRLEDGLRYMRAAEMQVLTVRRATFSSMSSVVYVMMAALFLIATALMLAVVWLLGYVRRLQGGLVTVCAWTKQVREGDQWMSLEAYLVDRFGLKITHGISDEAAAAFLADLDPPDRPSPGQ